LLCLLGAFLLSLPAFAAQAPHETIETWADPGTAGWSNEWSQTPLSNPAGYLNMQHTKQGSPRSVSDIARGNIPPGVLLTNISFRFATPHVRPSSVRLYFHSTRSNRLWYASLPTPGPEEESTFSVPVTYPAGWRRGPVQSEYEFLTDLRSVDWVGVYVRRHGDVASQDYEIDDFTVWGLQYTYDDDMDGMENDWEDSYSLDRDDWRDARWNKDNDPMDNYGESRAGTHPGDPDSYFTVEIAGTNQHPTARRVVLRWHSIRDRDYTVWRADDLDAGFQQLETVASDPYTNVYVDAGSTNIGPFYYFIEVE